MQADDQMLWKLRTVLSMSRMPGTAGKVDCYWTLVMRESWKRGMGKLGALEIEEDATGSQARRRLVLNMAKLRQAVYVK